MKSWTKLVLGAIMAAMVLTATAVTSADAPPPPSEKYVSYLLKIENLKAFADYVLFAYPWSTSNGAPTREHTLLHDGKAQRFGRRSPEPKLYAMKRSAYEKWLAGYTPPEDRFEDPALDALVKNEGVIACDKAPKLRFTLNSDDNTPQIVDVFRVSEITEKHCKLAGPPVAAKPLGGKKAAAPAAPSALPAQICRRWPDSLCSPPSAAGDGATRSY